MTPAVLLGYGLALYAGVGLCVAAVFVTTGVDRVLGYPASFSVPARVVLMPGAVALWPYVLWRWLNTGLRRP